jgi:methionyl-tRNA formyltransferase
VSRIRIVFCGTPQFAVPSLKHLIEQSDFEIIGVFTQPDRPKGRGNELAVSAVKETAISSGLPIHQPEKIKSAEAESILRNGRADVVVIIAYGQIIPARLLDIPRLGWINLHASLLPKYRGAAPINWAIANGETRTGVTTMKIDAGMDTGGTLLQHELAIAPKETAPELAARLADAGGPLMIKTLRGLADGSLAPKPQDPTHVSYAPLLKREDGRIAWTRPATEIYNRMRAFTPWPGSYTRFRGKLCHLSGEPAQSSGFSGLPGTIAATPNNGILIECGSGSLLRLERVKLEGRNEVSAAEFARGAHLASEERFGQP